MVVLLLLFRAGGQLASSSPIPTPSVSSETRVGDGGGLLLKQLDCTHAQRPKKKLGKRVSLLLKQLVCTHAQRPKKKLGEKIRHVRG